MQMIIIVRFEDNDRLKIYLTLIENFKLQVNSIIIFCLYFLFID